MRLTTFLPAAGLLFVAAGAAGAQQPGAAGDTIALSLPDAVERAVRSGEETGLASAQVDVTEAQFTVARAGMLPQLRLNGTYSRAFENARAQAVGQLFNQPNTYNVNANLSQSLFQGGRLAAGLRSARRLRQASRLTLSDARAAASLDVQRAYLDALLASRLVTIQESNFVVAAERVTQVEQFASAGRAARYDVLRARVERANLEPAVLQARADRDLALLALKQLVNVPAERPVVLTTAIDSTGVNAMLASVDAADGRARPTALPAADPAAAGGSLRAATPASSALAQPIAVGGRASVQAAELTAQARRDAVSIARADLLPTLSVALVSGFQAFPVTGTPFRRGELVTVPCANDPGTGVPDPGCRPTSRQNGGFFSDRQLQVQMSWPLFDGLRAKGAIDLAQAQARVAELQLRQERERVAVEVAQARAELARARATYAARQQTSAEADEAFRLASLRFARGVGTQLEVSDAQLALVTAQTSEARAVYDIYLAGAALAYSQGRPVPLPPPAAPAAPGERRTSALPAAAFTSPKTDNE